MNEIRQIWEYVSNRDNSVHRVYCTRLEFLFLKMHYGEGLNEQEYNEYKNN